MVLYSGAPEGADGDAEEEATQHSPETIDNHYRHDQFHNKDKPRLREETEVEQEDWDLGEDETQVVEGDCYPEGLNFEHSCQ